MGKEDGEPREKERGITPLTRRSTEVWVWLAGKKGVKRKKIKRKNKNKNKNKTKQNKTKQNKTKQNTTYIFNNEIRTFNC